MSNIFDLIESNGNLALEVGYNSIADWNVVIYDSKGRGLSESTKAVHVESCDYRYE